MSGKDGDENRSAAPQIHHSDQGLQYAAHAYVRLLKTHHVQISMATIGKAERFMRTIKEEEVDLSEYRDLADAQCQIGVFIQDAYMTKRIHSTHPEHSLRVSKKVPR